jgi:hypothetical protein|eukprot:COSAG02_NODE_2839_length_7917_cov_121.814786_4_plen_42_part_00
MILRFAESVRWWIRMAGACVLQNRYDEQLMAEWDEAPADEL